MSTMTARPATAPQLRPSRRIVCPNLDLVPYRTYPQNADEYIEMRSATALLPIFTVVLATAQTYTISTVAGGALPVNIPGISASLYGPQSALVIDPAGNVFFVDGNTVLRLDAVSNVLSLVAGNGASGYSGDSGPAVAAELRNPYGLALDSAGNIYIASFSDNVVRKVSGGIITTIAGNGTAGFSGDNGPAISAQLNAPY